MNPKFVESPSYSKFVALLLVYLITTCQFHEPFESHFWRIFAIRPNYAEGFHKNLQPSLMKTTENFNAFQLKYTNKSSGKTPTLIHFFRQIQMYAIDVQWLDIFFLLFLLNYQNQRKICPKNTWDTNKCQISATIHQKKTQKKTQICPDFSAVKFPKHFDIEDNRHVKNWHR